mgnify:CR=1 FL=1
MRDDIDITALKAELEMRLRELEALRERSAESRDAVELDQTRQGRVSRQDALMQQEMAKEAERRRATEMQRIRSALKRIESDDYGYCVKCDEEIAAKRLALDPAILTCIACAR